MEAPGSCFMFLPQNADHRLRVAHGRGSGRGIWGQPGARRAL